jgi:queuine tRNA-ribosyltransferase
MRVQRELGSDIAMAFDECTRADVTPGQLEQAVRRTTLWARRSRDAERAPGQLVFGIVQGATDLRMRERSAAEIIQIGFDGYAIGGLAVGEGHGAMCEVLDYAPGLLPVDRPRYLMGVGKPVDLVEAVARGVDMFDCVLPTRSGRHGQAWTSGGVFNLSNARFADDDTALDVAIDCPASRDYSKAYLHHLFKSGEILGQVLLSWHNLAYFQSLMAGLRAAIHEGRLADFRRDFSAAIETDAPA